MSPRVGIKDSDLNVKRKHGKDSEADETWSERDQSYKNDELYHVYSYRVLCDIMGYKRFLLIWKLRKSAAWDDEQKITVIGLLVEDERACHVLCVARPSLLGLITGARGACSVLYGNSKTCETRE